MIFENNFEISCINSPQSHKILLIFLWDQTRITAWQEDTKITLQIYVLGNIMILKEKSI